MRVVEFRHRVAKTRERRAELNINKLKGKMVEHQKSTEEMAKELGISCATLLRRLGEPETFTVSEVIKISKLLSLEASDIPRSDALKGNATPGQWSQVVSW